MVSCPKFIRIVRRLSNEDGSCATNQGEELIFSMLGDASTTAIVKTRNPKGFVENQIAAKQGGSVAGKARRDLETKTGKKVVSSENYLPESKKNKQLNKGKKK